MAVTKVRNMLLFFICLHEHLNLQWNGKTGSYGYLAKIVKVLSHFNGSCRSSIERPFVVTENILVWNRRQNCERCRIQ